MIEVWTSECWLNARVSRVCSFVPACTIFPLHETRFENVNKTKLSKLYQCELKSTASHVHIVFAEICVAPSNAFLKAP